MNINPLTIKVIIIDTIHILYFFLIVRCALDQQGA